MPFTSQRRSVSVGKPTASVRKATFEQVGEDDSRIFQFLASDASVDRMGDTIAVDGWDCSDFIANPTILFAHKDRELPVGKGLKVWTDELGLHVKVQIDEDEDKLLAKLKSGSIRAVSVGFKPLEMEWVERELDDGTVVSGVDFKRQELLEISICPVPANAHALAEARTKAMARKTEGSGDEAPGYVQKLGEHVEKMGGHVEALEKCVKAMDEHAEGTTGDSGKAFRASLKAAGFTEAQIATVEKTAADTGHAMHPDVHKVVVAAHKALCKALDLHNRAPGAQAGGDGKPGAAPSDDDDATDADDEKALALLAENQKQISGLITRVTGRVA